MHPLEPPSTRVDPESPGEAREAANRKYLKIHRFTPTHLKLVLKIPACNSFGGSNIRSILEAELAHKSIRLGYAYFAIVINRPSSSCQIWTNSQPPATVSISMHSCAHPEVGRTENIDP